MKDLLAAAAGRGGRRAEGRAVRSPSIPPPRVASAPEDTHGAHHGQGRLCGAGGGRAGRSRARPMKGDALASAAGHPRQVPGEHPGRPAAGRDRGEPAGRRGRVPPGPTSGGHPGRRHHPGGRGSAGGRARLAARGGRLRRPCGAPAACGWPPRAALRSILEEVSVADIAEGTRLPSIGAGPRRPPDALVPPLRQQAYDKGHTA